MDEELGELLVEIADSVVRLSTELSKIVDALGIITKQITSLRTDVDKLIENSGGGA